MMTCIQFQFCYRIQCRQTHTTSLPLSDLIKSSLFDNIFQSGNPLTCRTERLRLTSFDSPISRKGKRLHILAFPQLFVMKKIPKLYPFYECLLLGHPPARYQSRLGGCVVELRWISTN